MAGGKAEAMTPRKLARAIKEHKTQHRIAAALGVNPYYVNRYLKYGKEPTSKTIRAKMGFPPLRKKHTGRSGFAELPDHVKWWRKLDKRNRDHQIFMRWQAVIRHAEQ